MTESEIHANPQRLLSVAEELRSFTNSLKTELIALQSGLQRLGATWQDQEYAKFKQAFDRIKTQLEQLVAEVNKREPELKEDAQLLLNYLRKSL